MSNTTLVVLPRSSAGSANSRRLRADGAIPGVIYGQGMQPISVTVDRRELRLALSGPSGANTLLDLKVDGASYPAVVKELQRHPVRRTVNHIDFLQVNLKEEITVSVPVRLEGEAKEVLAANALVDPAVDTIDVSCTPANIPAEFLIDVTNMTPDMVIRLADVPMPAGVTALGDPEMAIVTVLVTSAAAVEEEAGEGEGDGEGEGTGEAAADGDAAAADAAE
jgi:large subunit ribosomal protein L25